MNGSSHSQIIQGPSAPGYDLSTARIAEEAGVVITGMRGEMLDAPLDTSTPVSWIGYANEDLRHQIEPVLLRLPHQP